MALAFDPLTGQRQLYLPGRNDKNYRLNGHAIIRGVEGKWFHSWTNWDTVVLQLIESHLRLKSLTAGGDE